jgi:hypothetical protein
MRHLLPPGHEIPAKPMGKDNGGPLAREFIADARIGALNPTGAARWGGEICWVGHAGLLPKASPASWAKMNGLSWAGAAAKAC